MATTTWDQKAGMTSPTATDNLTSYAERAEDAKDAAAASEAAASTSATNAATSATSASGSASSASADATAASASATASAASATAASASETNAAASEAAAATSEANAADSQVAAATSEGNAATSASIATTKASEALSSAAAASASETNAAASVQPYATRAAAVVALGDLSADITVVRWLSPDGQALEAVRKAGATTISDMLGWVPSGAPSPLHFGAEDDQSTAAWASQLSDCEAHIVAQGEDGSGGKAPVAAGGTYQRFLSTKLGDVLTVADFGVQYGDTADQSAALNSAIDAALDGAELVGSNMWRAGRSIDLGAGVIRVENALSVLSRGVEIFGRGNATVLKGYGAFDLLETQEFESDDTTPRYHWGMVFRDFQILNGDGANPLTAGIKARGLIRNSGMSRVLGSGCGTMFDIDRCWTLYFNHCGHEGVNGQTNHHVKIGSNSGAITLNGGRYDVADLAGVYADATDQLELFIVNDVAIQFGKQAAVEVAGSGARTVKIIDSFFEGNCIGNPSKHYLEIQGSGTSLSSCEVRGNVMNNLADSNRDGDGVAAIDGFQTVIYDTGNRWVRNNVKVFPTFGSNIGHAHLRTGSAAAISNSDLPFLAGNNDNSAIIERPDRPMLVYGQAMDNGSVSLDTKAAFIVGTLDGGRASHGEYGGRPAVQGHGTGSGFDYHLNPYAGNVFFGQSSAQVTAGTNEFFGRFRAAAQLTSGNLTPNAATQYGGVNCTSGARALNLNNLTLTAGAFVLVGKTDGTTNALQISDADGGVTRAQINGVDTYSLTQPYEQVLLVCTGSEWRAVDLRTAASMSLHDVSVDGMLNIAETTELTIASGAVTVANSYHLIDTEADAATDDLDTINGGSDGDVIILQTANSARDVTVKHATGNIFCGSDKSLNGVADAITLRKRGSNWHCVAYANN